MLKVSTSNLIRTLEFGKPYLGYLFLAAILNVLATTADIGFLYLLKSLIDAGFVAQNLALIKWFALGALAIVLIRSILTYFSSYILSYVEGRITMDIQNSLYRRIQGLSLDFHISLSPGYLITLIFYDAHAALRIITSFSGTLIRELFRIPAVIFFLFTLHSQMALFALLFFPPVLVSIRFFGIMLKRATQEMQGMVTKLYTVTEKALSHIDVIKIFAKEKAETERFRRLNEEMFISSLKAFKATGLNAPANQLIKMATVIILVFLGTREVMSGELSVGSFTTFLASAYYLYGSFSSLSSWYFSLLSGLVSAERVLKVLGEKPRVVPPLEGVKVNSLKREIRLDNITFRYPGSNKEVIKSLTFYLNRGETLAIVGLSGSGKSTLIRLLLRLYDPSEGRISIDGNDITALEITSLRDLFGVATQESGLFQDTVVQAICYGFNGASLEDVMKAAEIAGINDFIKQLPQGYQTPIGERGLKLSGGEAQRIALARAILRDPDILVLDEALSSVDAPTERLILERISEERRGRTNIIISHRLSSIAHADRILVLKSGRIVEEGGHQELMTASSYYHEWFLLQRERLIVKEY